MSTSAITPSPGPEGPLPRPMPRANTSSEPHSAHCLMAAVGPSPFSEYLLRQTGQAAKAQGSPWLAVYVDPGLPLRKQSKERLENNLSLARRLGGEVLFTAGSNIAKTLLAIAQERGVTQIFVGANDWSLRWPFSIVHQLLRDRGEIDICMVRSPGRKKIRLFRFPGSWFNQAYPFRDLVLGGGAVLALTAVCWFLQRWTGYWSIALLYLALVIFLATKLSRGAILLMAALSGALWNFLFIPPLYTFRIGRLNDALMLGMYLLVALVMGQLAARLHRREEEGRRREQRTRALYRLAQNIIQSTDLETGLAAAINEIQKLYHAAAAVVLARDDGKLSCNPRAAGTWIWEEQEWRIASRAYSTQQPAGRFTPVAPESAILFLPLTTAKDCLGVLGVRFPSQRTLTLDERELLEAFADHIAAMVERYTFMQHSHRLHLAEESERLYKTLLNCVSHELKTPLAIISAAAEELDRAMQKQKAPRIFLEEIEAATRRLHRVVNNLLDMSRIESGCLKPELTWCDADDLIEAARIQTGDALAQHRLSVFLPPDLPAVRVDAGFLEHALANLLTNAGQYSPPGTEVSVSGRIEGGNLVLDVADQGPGIPPEAFGRIFDKFYRGPNAAAGGTGLGLAIVQGLLQALGGEARAANRPEGGAVLTMRVPVQTAAIGREAG